MKVKNNSNLKYRTTANGLIYRTQLEGILNKFDKQSNRQTFGDLEGVSKLFEI